MKTIKKYKYLITIILIILIVCYAIYLKRNLRNKKYDNLNNQEDITLNELVEEIKETTCNIDIKGAVKKPGVYKLSCTLNISDAIKSAGGVTEEADTSVINLAKQITNEMVIIVYTKEEVKNSNIVDTVVKVVESECVCPNIQNDGCINTEIKDTIGSNNSLININTANQSELQELPGIGASKAKTIIEYREKNGKFQQVEDILNVDGIGNTLYEQIKAYITT